MDQAVSQYDIGLDKTPANFVALSPVSFLERSAHVYPALASVVHEQRRFTWAETYSRCRRFASWLARRARHPPWRHGRGHAAEHSGDV